MDWLKEIERLEASESEETRSAAVVLRSLYLENQRMRKFNADISKANQDLNEELQRIIKQAQSR